MDVETKTKASVDSMLIVEDAESHSAARRNISGWKNMAEWELLTKHDDYLRVKASFWIESLRQYHRYSLFTTFTACNLSDLMATRNLPTMRECASLFVAVFIALLPLWFQRF